MSLLTSCPEARAEPLLFQDQSIEPLQYNTECCPETALDLLDEHATDALCDFILRQECIENTNKTESTRNNEVYQVSRNPETYEVSVKSDVTLEDYERITPPENWQMLMRYATNVHGKNIVFVNPTMEGGGVAMLRPPIVHILNLLGVHAHWFVMEGRQQLDGPNPFEVTKKIHNISQRRLGNARLTDEEKLIHWQWNEQNAQVLQNQEAIQQADVLFIDDPQPAPLKKLLANHLKPSVKFIWRNHIDTDHNLMSDASTPQGEVAEYLLNQCGIGDQNVTVVAHPVDAFLHPGKEHNTYFAPATTDPFDDLNRKLDHSEIAEGIQFINDEIASKNQELVDQGRFEDVQSYIDTKRKRITLVARFDESKGMDHAMELGAEVRKRMRELGYQANDLPQIILVGNGSIDDPSGPEMFEHMLQLRRDKYNQDKADIIIMRLKHNYSAMNALMYPSNQHDAQLIGMQTSEAEGCETRISDWIGHGIPVVVFNNGGMPLQVDEEKSGFVLDFHKPDHDINRGADIITKLMIDSESYFSLCKTTEAAAREFNDREFTTTANVTRLLRVMSHVLQGITADKIWKLSEMIC